MVYKIQQGALVAVQNPLFIGRKEELKQLLRLKKKPIASLVCLLGRRRIGKSSLISEFSKQFKKFIVIQGLGPDQNSSLQDQLNNFATKLREQFDTRQEHFENWTEALSYLGKKVVKGETLVLLDEISWMGKGDPLFAAKIKDAWDTYFKKNNKLTLVLCGSVSVWIEENILMNTNFEGRVSLEINLKELSLPEIHQFWIQNNFLMGSFEKMLILSITGGVPKYLEEVLKTEDAESNILQLCFNESGLLFNDFKKIFVDILGRRSKKMEQIVRKSLQEKLSPAELAVKMKTELNGELTRSINILELSGFISRDYYFNPDGHPSKLNHLRVKDNYLRFYLKVIEPQIPFIQKGGKKITSLKDIKGWSSIMGLQFENLILQNRDCLLPLLNISQTQLISSAPYIQHKKTTNKGACQIDLLIHTHLDVFYLVEMKCQKNIDLSVIKEVKKKVDTLQLPRRSSLKTVLVYEGELTPNTAEALNSFFFKLISFTELLEG
jgi:AAA+ ATPase superfamily predicted ATPase